MKTLLSLSLLCCLAAGVQAADDLAAEVKAAAQQLAGKSGYAWTSTPKSDGQQRFRQGPTEGRLEKDGWTHTKSTMGDSEVEVLRKGDRGAVKREGEWRTLADLEEDERGAWFARRIRNAKAPAAEAGEMAGNTKGLARAEGGAYAGELTQEAAEALLSWGGRRPNAPGVQNAKGSVKFWLKDGLLTKYEYTLSGTFKRPDNDEETKMERTVTVEIKDVGTTKVPLPDDVKQKLS
ncbi:MAG: Intracellular endo-alpha-(1-_5)-L-arabinanase [Verrucomicrobiota bacterium]|jgi:hypothetical protein